MINYQRFQFITAPLLILLAACMTPSDPDGVRTRGHQVIDTGGYCRDIAFNDSLMFVAADENGYQVYRYDWTAANQFEADWQYGVNDINDDNGIDPIGEVYASENMNFFFAMDFSDGIYFNIPFDPDISDWIPTGDSDTRDIVRSMAFQEISDTEIIAYVLKRNVDGTGGVDPDGDHTFVSVRHMEVQYWGDLFLGFSADFTSYEPLSIGCEDIYLADSLLTVGCSQLGVEVLHQDPAGDLTAFSSFDTPGNVESVFSIGNRIFAGLGNNQGCYTALLDPEGVLVHTLQIAAGYSVYGIDFKDGVLALACGSNGVLLYRWSGNPDDGEFKEWGWLDTDYAYNVVVHGHNGIFAATRSGVEYLAISN